MALAFTGVVWCAPQDTWRFVTVPDDVSELIRLEAGPPTAFGAVRVEATIGATTWRTSVFPSAGRGPYVLPVKAAVRRTEQLDDGDEAAVRLRLLES